MPQTTRKEFLQTSAVLLATIFTGTSFDFKKNKPLLSFSTLGCPDWTFQQIASFAVQHGYKGIEVRGIQRQLDLTKCPEFSTEENIGADEGKRLAICWPWFIRQLTFPRRCGKRKEPGRCKKFY